MATPGYMTIYGEQQGEISGFSYKQGQEDKIEVFSFRHAVQIPSSSSNQVMTGEPIHRPIILSKEVDKSTPKLYQALCQKEILETTEIIWFRHNPQGVEELHYTVKLVNARILGIEPWTPDFMDPEIEQYRFMENVSLSYERILWSSGSDGDVEFETSWYSKEQQGTN